MNKAIHYRLVFWSSTAICTALGVGTWLVFRDQLPPIVPWFYSLPWGEQQLRPNEWLLLAPGVCLLASVVITLMALKLTKDEILTALLFVGGVVFQVVMTLALVRVVFVVI